MLHEAGEALVAFTAGVLGAAFAAMSVDTPQTPTASPCASNNGNLTDRYSAKKPSRSTRLFVFDDAAQFDHLRIVPFEQLGRFG